MANVFDTDAVKVTADFLSVFGETGTYHPAAGAPRIVTCVVSRNPVGMIEGLPQGHGPNLEIYVANDIATGIAISEVDTGRDKFSLSVNIGEAAQQRRITKISAQDAGMLKLALN